MAAYCRVDDLSHCLYTGSCLVMSMGSLYLLPLDRLDSGLESKLLYMLFSASSSF